MKRVKLTIKQIRKPMLQKHILQRYLEQDFPEVWIFL